METAAWILAGYLLGSLSSAIVVCRALGLPDPRTQGSRNPGATNVLRIGGRRAAALTLAGDMLKGLVPVAAARLAGLDPFAASLVGLAAFLGHLYPVFFGFQGGKGVATLLGVLLGLHPLAGLLTVGTWLATAALWRISSLSALVASALAPLYTLWATGAPRAAGTVAVMTVLLYWRHRSNIRNLMAGREEPIRGPDR
ncbi:glycerol-3-phosphate 1-O-acyltransferase PlsY [Inmirania thermothiophila]|uniref:Glycerol-3-phosphate acyltransferase n=1 Tax=Inmirania thermothiophila TaxID=1750597 RepID=A0A3N1Y600_9GAMM|nr:glycerol-3-phosphate 1-O-acyltransferase PlsY [Inmirania thermothiophila]ROR34180.1 acyl-phosphate glycerol-3-phosphate acyltransferase [Inmirania thermothiophila]